MRGFTGDIKAGEVMPFSLKSGLGEQTQGSAAREQRSLALGESSGEGPPPEAEKRVGCCAVKSAWEWTNQREREGPDRSQSQ